MTIEEYNEELKMLRDNIALCKQNEGSIQNEKNILNTVKPLINCEREVLRLRKYLNERCRLNSDMLDNFNWALSHLKINKDYDEVYFNYLEKCRSSMGQYIKLSQDLDYITLADKYIGDVTLYVD